MRLGSKLVAVAAVGTLSWASVAQAEDVDCSHFVKIKNESKDRVYKHGESAAIRDGSHAFRCDGSGGCKGEPPGPFWTSVGACKGSTGSF